MTKIIEISMKFVLALIIAISLVSCGGQEIKPGITVELFGFHNGQMVKLYTMVNKNGVILKVSNFGGTITELHVPDRDGNLGDIVLGFDKHEGYISPEYLKSNPYFGAIIGRYGNRIAGGKFTLDDVDYKLATNDGENHLHGGIKGFDKVVWDAKIIEGSDKDGSEQTIVLTYTSKHGEEGYPGNLKITVLYSLNNENELRIEYTTETDKATPCNLTNHSYFNLSAGKHPTIENHVLEIFADQYTEVDAGLIPTGNFIDVVGTPMDFTTPRTIGERINDNDEQLTLGKGYDHNWVLRESNGWSPVATLYEPESGRFMEVFTSEPGIQFYSGNFLDGTITGKNNKKYQHRAGLCLETQHFPDSPNQPTFPCTILKPGDASVSETVYRFSVK